MMVRPIILTLVTWVVGCGMPSNIPETEIELPQASKADELSRMAGHYRGVRADVALGLEQDRSFEMIQGSRATDGTYQVTQGVDSGNEYLRLNEAGRVIARYRVQWAGEILELTGTDGMAIELERVMSVAEQSQ